MNLTNIDFNLLKALDALVAERNVTKASKRLGRSQPAVSNALQRLRQLLGDDLLVRGPSGFVLTPRAEAIREPLREAMGLMESCLAEAPQFDPAKATGVFRLSTPDRLSIALLPPLFARLRRVMVIVILPCFQCARLSMPASWARRARPVPFAPD